MDINAIRILDEPNEYTWTPPESGEHWYNRFQSKRKTTLFIMAAWVASIVFSSTVTGMIIKHNTTVEVTALVQSEMRQGFRAYLDQMEQEQKASEFLTGEDSFETAVVTLAGPMSKLIATYAQDYGVQKDGLYTLGWVFCARVARNSTEFGTSPQEVLEKKNAWEGNPVDHPVRNQDLGIADIIARDFLNGQYPDNYTDDLTFLVRKGSEIIARDEYNPGPYTRTWQYGK